MRNEHTIAVVIPALNEEAAIGRVLRDIPAWVDDVVVADNGSTDGTAAAARAQGARVVSVPERGYGAACLAGIAALASPDVVVFLDGDYSDHPEEMPLLVDPVIRGEVDLMIGSRMRGAREAGALSPQAAFGNWLATRLIRLFWGIRYTDLGPFRAIRYRTLLGLDMRDRDYGWTVEMQIKAALHAVPADEVPVSYRRREGVSKVSGTVRGVVGAGCKILGTIAASALFSRPALKTGLLVNFARFPEAGLVKTRLVPAMGAAGAAELYRAMAEHCVALAPPPLPEVETQVRYTGAERGAFRDWLGPAHLYAAQGEGELGARLARALEEGFEQAYGKVVICGTDCPGLDSARTAEAFAALDEFDVVMGPAEDGGFYLIGMRLSAAPYPVAPLFDGVEWGGAGVYEAVAANAAALGLSLRALAPLPDVDLLEDLAHWEAARARERLSIIIPALNEAERIGPLVQRLCALPNTEIIVVDGGSEDATRAIAASHGAAVIDAPRGRAAQMNAGAAVSTGERLLFLHADATPPPDVAGWVRRTLAFERVALGAFSLRIDGPGRAYRWIAGLANLRSAWLGMPYGDQGMFLRRETFEALGGFQELPILEDYALARSARRAGLVVTLPQAMGVSPRRWEREGTVWVTLRNVAAFFAYPCGVSPARIARWYGR
ncbi:MAG: TIGR04283 family arsenosugar biosynthesis glycosyltransferase [Candidatus Hydrogenedentes bacterium]|nr:TIGR04283 family arsenosugar biosynthesis glycosyltransferase [Candidatus Hydrogenedentota bacterium]